MTIFARNTTDESCYPTLDTFGACLQRRGLHTMIKRTLLVILIGMCPLNLALAEDWTQWRGPDRTGVSKETDLLESWPPAGPKLLWTFRDAGVGYSSISVMGDRLYSMGAVGNKDCVYAIDLKTKKKLWSVKVGILRKDPDGDGPCSTPTIDGNFLYAIGGHGDLVCVETASGRKVWSQSMKRNLGGGALCYGYTESPLIDGNQVVATPGGGKGAIAAFDKKTGTLKWRSTTCTDTAGCSSMIVTEVGGVRQYVQMTNESLVGVRASDGKLLWKLTKNGLGTSLCVVTPTPIYQNDCVYVNCGSCCNLLKFMLDEDKFKAEQVYRNQEMQNWYNGVILVGECVYGCSDKGGWICQDFKTGNIVWKEFLRMGRGSVTFADGNLYCYHENRGDVLLIKATPAGYKELGRFRIPEESELRSKGGICTHPVVANGKLYLRDQELIFCYDVHKSH